MEDSLDSLAAANYRGLPKVTREDARGFVVGHVERPQRCGGAVAPCLGVSPTVRGEGSASLVTRCD